MFNRVRSFSFSSKELDSPAPEESFVELPTELREAYESWYQSSMTPDRYSRAVSESAWPVSIFVPERYEERYAYPLLTWFHSDGNDEGQLDAVMRKVSSQNFIGLGLRGNKQLADGSHCWDAANAKAGNVPLSPLLHLTTCRLRRAFHIHSERIFLAGCGRGADAALRLMQQHPEWFAGAILLDPACDFPEANQPQAFAGLKGASLLCSVAQAGGLENMARSVRTIRHLRQAGATVEVDLTEDFVDPDGDEMRMIDRWVMNQILQESCV